MIAASSTEVNTPNSTNLRVAAEEALKALHNATSKVVEFVQEAVSGAYAFDKSERTLQEITRRVAHQAMEVIVAAQGDGDLGETVQTSEGETLRRSETPTTTRIRSIFGEHEFEQYTYSKGKGRTIELRPVSARLELPAQQWSYLTQELGEMLAVDQSYEQATTNLERILGGKFSVDTAERINGQMGQAAGKFLDDLPYPAPDSEAKLLVASMDCKGVPLVKEDAAKVAAFEQAKKRPGNRRMATVTSVYSVEPHIRSAEEITAALFRDELPKEDAKPKRPKPQNKNTTAHFPQIDTDESGETSTISGIHVGAGWAMDQIDKRRRRGQVLVVVMDGQESLWDTMYANLNFGERTVGVLDIIHVSQYIWKSSQLLEEDTDARKAFTRVRLQQILEGRIQGVIRGLRRMGTMRSLAGKDLDDLNGICGYLEKNADRMQYDKYLRRGYPIASGVIEGACRHLVKDRMERSGMRWTLEGARSMLHLRAAHQGDHWRTFLDQRIRDEVQKNHKHRDLLDNYKPITLAC